MSVSPVINFNVPNTAQTSFSSSSGSASSTPKISPYVQQYNNLLQYDAQELFTVSLGTPQNAQANIEGVLAQWVGLQQQEQQAQQQAIQAALDKVGSSNTNAPNIPSLSSLQAQSDAQASTALANYSKAAPGSSNPTRGDKNTGPHTACPVQLVTTTQN